MTTLRDGATTGTGEVTRRNLLKGGAAVGVAAAAGLEGILAAQRAPAWAQGTRLNIVRWVDFIPACDVELKRQAGDASKALGAEVRLRVHQRQRHSAPDHRRDAVRLRPRHHPHAAQLAPPVRERPRRGQ
jgi:anaerobic selenocysteine-containing dehydrogenase